jgi:hypothetical protein
MRLFLATSLAAVMPLAAKSVNKLSDFTLADQHSVSRTYQFPKSKVTVITVADHKGSDQLAPWIERLYSRYEKRIDIDGVADVSMIPKPFQPIFRAAFKKQLTYSVMLDWQGSVVNQFAYRKGVANLYVIDRAGRILKQITGPVTDSGFEELTREVDRAIK